MNNDHQITEGWDKGFIVTMATVKSVVDQYAEGKIQLEFPYGKGRHNIRYAGPDGTKPYTASTVGKFLGWLQPDGKAALKTFTAINALQLVEEGKIDVSAFAGISEIKAYEILTNLKRQELTSDDPAPVNSGSNGHHAQPEVTVKRKDTISLSVEDAKKIHHTLISLAQSCLELAKLVDV